MISRKAMLTAFGVLMLGVVVCKSSDASFAAHRDNLTFHRSVALPGVTLPVGNYAFEIVAGDDVVRVMSRDGSRTFFTGFTRAVRRPNEVRRASSIQLGEAAEGKPLPIMVWFPPSADAGREFIWDRK